MSRTTELGLGLTHLSSVSVALSLPWVSFPPLGVRAWPGHSTPKAPLAPEPCLKLQRPLQKVAKWGGLTCTSAHNTPSTPGSNTIPTPDV